MAILSFEGVKIEEAPRHVVPICPKCERELEVIWLKAKGSGLIQRQEIIMCPYCKAFLGFGTMSV